MVDLLSPGVDTTDPLTVPNAHLGWVAGFFSFLFLQFFLLKSCSDRVRRRRQAWLAGSR